MFQNPYGSGEFFGVVLDEYDDWGFGSFVYDLFYKIIANFINYDNVTINFGILGDINSSQFTLGNTTITNFIGLFADAFLIILMIFWYYRLVKAFATVDLTTLTGYEIDNMFNLF